LGDEDLPVLGLRTEPGGKIAYRADGRVANVIGETNLA
jgi:hypothetical protein